MTSLSGPLAVSDSQIYPSALALQPSKSGPGGPDSGPPEPGEICVFLGEVDDFSPGLECRVGDQFGHPEGVQVKTSNLSFSSHPIHWTGEFVIAMKTLTRMGLVVTIGSAYDLT